MEENIRNLVKVSRYYGVNKDYVIAGGGNTSYKNTDNLWIKASGVSLANISSDGFVCLSRSKLRIIYVKKYSNNSAQREIEVKNDLNGAIVSKNRKRPSVESSLHDIIDYPFVVHTHPTLVNSLLCSKKARILSGELFGDDILFIKYTDPGYTLFKKVSDELVRFRKLKGFDPKIILLENHGIIVSGESIQEIKDIYKNIEKAILKKIKLVLPGNNSQTFNTAIKELVVNCIKNNKSGVVNTISSDIIREFVRDKTSFEDVETAFTPDHIVYCKSHYLFVDDKEESKALEDLKAFNNKYGYYPKIIAIKNKGLLIIEDNISSADIVKEMILNMMKISIYARSFGGSKSLDDKKIAFIENWEAENYRKQLIENVNQEL